MINSAAGNRGEANMMTDPYDPEEQEEQDDSQLDEEEPKQEDAFFDDPFMAFIVGPFAGDGL